MQAKDGNTECPDIDGSSAADGTPTLTPEQQVQCAKTAAHRALDAAEKAWYDYAGLCEVGPERTRAFDVYENVRLARRL